MQYNTNLNRWAINEKFQKFLKNWYCSLLEKEHRVKVIKSKSESINLAKFVHKFRNIWCQAPPHLIIPWLIRRV